MTQGTIASIRGYLSKRLGLSKTKITDQTEIPSPANLKAVVYNRTGEIIKVPLDISSSNPLTLGRLIRFN